RNNRELVERAESVRAQARHLAENAELLERERQRIAGLQTAQEATETALADRRATLAGLEKRRDALHEAERAASLLTTVPFGVRCGESGCQFVRAAVEAKARIPELQDDADERATVAARIRDDEQALREGTREIR